MSTAPILPRVHAVDVAGPNLTTMCPSESQQRLQYGITFDEIYVRTDAEVNCKHCLSTIALFPGGSQIEGDPVLGDFRVVLRSSKERWTAGNQQRKRNVAARKERLLAEQEHAKAEQERQRITRQQERQEADQVYQTMVEASGITLGEAEVRALIEYLPRIAEAMTRGSRNLGEVHAARRDLHGTLNRVEAAKRNAFANEGEVMRGFDRLHRNSTPIQVYQAGVNAAFDVAIRQIRYTLNPNTAPMSK
jgi:hypothetical protein